MFTTHFLNEMKGCSRKNGSLCQNWVSWRQRSAKKT